jgi:hypothetical protein
LLNRKFLKLIFLNYKVENSGDQFDGVRAPHYMPFLDCAYFLIVYVLLIFYLLLDNSYF